MLSTVQKKTNSFETAFFILTKKIPHKLINTCGGPKLAMSEKNSVDIEKKNKMQKETELH